MQIIGNIRRGCGVATQTLALQLPHIGNEFPEVAACHRGSINLELELPLLVLAPDHRTQPIAWKTGITEVFDFLRIELEAPPDSSPISAWLYIPHDSPHRRTPHIHEVITTTQLNLAGVTMCRIRINRSAFQLPLPQFRALVVV